MFDGRERNFSWHALRAAAGLLLVLGPGCAFAATPLPELVDEINATKVLDWKASVVHPGDTLELRLQITPEQLAPAVQRAIVRPDGMANMPVVGDVETGGFNSQTDALLEIARRSSSASTRPSRRSSRRRA